MEPVPEFFQSDTADARRAQVDWLRKYLDLTSLFFAKVLDVEPSRIDRWSSGDEPVDADRQRQIGRLWSMFLHLLSLSNFDYSRTRQLLEAKAQPIVFTHSGSVQSGSSCAVPGSDLPWAGKSMRVFLESHGEAAIDEVNQWATSFRFSDRYASSSRRWHQPVSMPSPSSLDPHVAGCV